MNDGDEKVYPIGAWANEPDVDYIEATIAACQKQISVPSPYKSISRNALVRRKRAGETFYKIGTGLYQSGTTGDTYLLEGVDPTAPDPGDLPNVEPEWKDWSVLVDGDPWRYLRQQLGIGVLAEARIIMCPRTFAKSPFAKDWRTTVNGTLKILPDGYIGKLWGRGLYLDPKGRFMRVRVMHKDNVIKTINLEKQSVWEQ